MLAASILREAYHSTLTYASQYKNLQNRRKHNGEALLSPATYASLKTGDGRLTTGCALTCLVVDNIDDQAQKGAREC